MSESVEQNSGPSQSAASSHYGLTERDAGVCLFTAAGKRFAVDTALVGEIIGVSRLLKVPLAPAPVLGLFSLRGSPVAVVDLLAVFGQPTRSIPSGELQVLVLRTDDGVLAGLLVDRLEAVVPGGRGTKTMSEGATEHPAVVGFFTLGDGQPTSILLGSRQLVTALQGIGFQGT